MSKHFSFPWSKLLMFLCLSLSPLDLHFESEWIFLFSISDIPLSLFNGKQFDLCFISHSLKVNESFPFLIYTFYPFCSRPLLLSSQIYTLKESDFFALPKYISPFSLFNGKQPDLLFLSCSLVSKPFFFPSSKLLIFLSLRSMLWKWVNLSLSQIWYPSITHWWKVTRYVLSFSLFEDEWLILFSLIYIIHLFLLLP